LTPVSSLSLHAPQRLSASAWEQVALPAVAADMRGFVAAPTDAALLFACSAQPMAYWRSTDAGAHWTRYPLTLGRLRISRSTRSNMSNCPHISTASVLWWAPTAHLDALATAARRWCEWATGGHSSGARCVAGWTAGGLGNWSENWTSTRKQFSLYAHIVILALDLGSRRPDMAGATFTAECDHQWGLRAVLAGTGGDKSGRRDISLCLALLGRRSGRYAARTVSHSARRRV